MQPFHVPTIPGLQPLPRARRRFVFFSLVAFFFCAVPIFVFYATGYRYDFFDADATITSTGGLYITVGEGGGEVYLNESPVRDLRVFRNAIYIQNLTPGMQRLHVQAPGLHTWVKELPVYPHIVTEVEAFALPVVPQVRIITEYETSTGTAVAVTANVPEFLLGGVSTTVPFIATTSRATTTLTRNTEYEYVAGLFATTTIATSTLLTRVATGVTEAFQFSPVPDKAAVATGTVATSTKQKNDLLLVEQGDDIVVLYAGIERNIPYYFCVPFAALASTSELYGPQVMRGVASVLAAASEVSETVNQNRICRDSIKVDRQWREVIAFDFFPGGTDLVVLHREDGIFVTEVDDRSWQNTQALFPYPVDEMVIESGRLYAKQGTFIFELLTELPTTL